MNVTHTDISNEIHGVKPSKLKLKTLQKRFENKTSLSSQEFLDYLDSYAKPSASMGVRSLGIGVRTERNVRNLISIANKTNPTNAERVTMTFNKQLRIADAIDKGKFGDPIPAEVALKIAEKLKVFTNFSAYYTVASAIDKGKFGDPIPAGVTEKIIDNLPLWHNFMSKF